MSEESWLPVPGHETRYWVSDMGNMRGIHGDLSLTPDRYGYLRVLFSLRGKKTTHSVAKLVALTFIGPRPAGHQVAHRNGNRTDNRAANLGYLTAKENIAEAIEHGTFSGQAGERHARATLSADQVRAIFIAAHADHSMGAQKRIAAQFGTNSGRVWQIKWRKCWRSVTRDLSPEDYGV